MLALLQRVTQARVCIGDDTVAAIGPGLLAFIGVEKGDSRDQADRLLERILGYRMFADAEGRMNLSLSGVGGGLLLVPQFTLPADTRKGMRPSFTPAASPQEGRVLFSYLVSEAEAQYDPVGTGQFGAHMAVHLTNDGPVTFMLRTAPPTLETR